MKLRIASDVGGTFTDSIAYDPVVAADQPSPRCRRRRRPARSAPSRACAATLRQLGATGSAVAYVGHGMTTATNAVIQRSGARTAFVTNRGFRGPAADRTAGPAEPLRRRRRARAAAGAARALLRHRRAHRPRAGARSQPLDQAQTWRRPPPTCARRAWRRWRSSSCTPMPTLRTSARPRRCSSEHLPGVAVCISTDILREFREFERASTVVLNAFLTPIMASYLGSLSGRLHDAEDGLGIGRDTPIMVMEAAGGLMTVETRARQAGAHRPVGPGRRRRRRRAFRRAGRAPATSSPWTSAAPAPTSA